MEFPNDAEQPTTENHESIAPKTTFGPSQLEVRFKNLSVSSKTSTLEMQQLNGDAPPELPTIWNTLKRAVQYFVLAKKTTQHDILKGLNGVLRPGTMTLVLGQPGSGKSTLLKALSGRLRTNGSRLNMSGEITYNGESHHLVSKQLPLLIAYVAQKDEHFPLLSVQETLSFAHAFCAGIESDEVQRPAMLRGLHAGHNNQQALKSALEMFENHPEVIKEQLGLQNCWNTVVGDTMVRGVSGGEKKRVTIGEMILGMQPGVFMDEISTGLDSAATFDIVNTQRTIAQTLGKTMVISLLQPPPDVFELFDDVILLNEGDVMYYGPRETVVDYFRELGLLCPPNRDIADFLLDLATPQQHTYESSTMVDSGRVKPPRLVSEYAEVFRSSDIHLDDVDVSSNYNKIRGEFVQSESQYQRSVWANLLTLVRRQFMLIMRDTNTLRSRIVLLLVVAVVSSTAFMNVNPTNVPLVLGSIFQSVLFPLFEQTSQLAMFVKMRDVFYKQRSGNFFQTSAYVLANVISQVPLALPESLIYGAFMYWIAGLENDIGSFFLFEVIIFLTVMAAILIFFFVAAISPNIYITNPVALGILQAVFLFAGFIVTRSQIPNYLTWVYWLDPMAWSFRALAVNEYRSAALDVCKYEKINYCEQYGKTMGKYYLDTYDIPSDKEWVVFGILYLVGLIMLFTVLSYFALEYKRYERDVRVIKVTTSNDEELVTFVPVTLAFKDLWYSVPNPSKPTESIDLLKGISGIARPGTITALMGSSGAGKTTLMDVIAGRKNTGSIRGTIMLNGHEATKLAIQRCSGYCEQTDIHSETATFREALIFSALLRQDSDIPMSGKIDSVNEIINLLGLQTIADHMVRGSSLEQLKRLTIGVELAAQPSVIFLDEPTSGLDARLAKLIMDGIRKVANSGRTIICTIHQPSYEVFSVFDNLLLLKRGGETVFFGDLGEDCKILVDYFEEIDGVYPLPEEYNPATWMLECIGAGVKKTTSDLDNIDFVQCFNKSVLKLQLDVSLEESGVGRPSPHIPALVFDRKRAASFVTQVKLLNKRFFTMYWRSPAHCITIIGVAIVSVLVLGLVGSGLSTTSYRGISSGLGVIFVAFQFQGFVSFNSAIPFAFNDRAVFYRERSSQTYSALAYFLAGTLVEIPYVFAKGLIISALLFLLMSFTGFAKFILFWLAVSLSILVDVYTGHFLAFALPNIVMAALTGSVVSTIFFLFIGFNPQGSSISAGYVWLYTITPQRYAMSILALLVYGDCSTNPELNVTTGEYINGGPEIGCQSLGDAPVSIGIVTVKGLLEDVYNMHQDDMARNFGVLLIFIVVFRALTLLALQFLNHQKR
ncbi:ABC Superfamily [Phytophthora palmivora]|uniref:ABC Superfamily n=1 Tax=Phytophthora palmivora TaxID=4796 RepID=A0A2P4XWE9_9STRA|nr:ABC Superfamily [Phytophthora palmivora]